MPTVLRFAPTRSRHCRRGAVMGMVAVGLIALLGCAGLTIDLGLAFFACQQCQNAADAGALGGGQELPYADRASNRAEVYVWANIPPALSEDFDCDVDCYSVGETVPGIGEAPHGGAIVVTVSKWVPFHFLRVLGFDGVTVTRRAVANKVLSGACIAPMWIQENTPVVYGQVTNLLMADAPHVGIPGSFGFLQPAAGVDFIACLKGLLTPEQEELQRVQEGDIVWAQTGLSVGQWRSALATDWDSRLRRASRPPYAGDTFDDYHPDNPRILVVPFVRYLVGTGSNARFRVIRFGAFWLEDVITSGNDRYIRGRFIDFVTPGGTGYSIKASRLVG